MVDAMACVVDSRRVLEATYIYGYYLDPGSGTKDLFEFMQKMLEDFNEQLHGMMEGTLQVQLKGFLKDSDYNKALIKNRKEEENKKKATNKESSSSSSSSSSSLSASSASASAPLTTKQLQQQQQATKSGSVLFREYESHCLNLMESVKRFKEELLDGLEVGLMSGDVEGRCHLSFTLEDEVLKDLVYAKDAKDKHEFEEYNPETFGKVGARQAPW